MPLRRGQTNADYFRTVRVLAVGLHMQRRNARQSGNQVRQIRFVCDGNVQLRSLHGLCAVAVPASRSIGTQRQALQQGFEFQLGQCRSGGIAADSGEDHILPGMFQRNLTVYRRQLLAHDGTVGMLLQLLLHLPLQFVRSG
ncbi:hypothetical protein D3C75_655860 [compost metagenome]